tara:strand:- start:67 stop:636 length:570 start_codon:yes stop_codon:yes gene_type:complete
MRLPLISPDDLTDVQKPLYEDMHKGIGSNFNSFKAVAEDGALMGPWNPWLHEPKIGGAIWDLTKVMSMEATLPEEARQVAILVTGAQFDAAYELYAHVAVAESAGMDKDRIATIVAGTRPSDMSEPEAVSYDVAISLASGRKLPRATYDRAVETFGQHGTNELIYLVGLYCLVSVTLNGFAVPVPDEAQ